MTRVYFEFLVALRTLPEGRTMEEILAALKAEGCQVRRARYPLLHQQPFFTEGHAAAIARLPTGVAPPDFAAQSLPQIELGNTQLLALPSFPRANRDLLDQYATAFAKVLGPR